MRIFERQLEIRDMTTMALLRCHPLAYKKGEVLLPNAERIFNPARQTRQILRQTEAIGPNAHALCQRLVDKRGREAQKSMWGIVALVPRLPARIVEQAATIAIARHISCSNAVRLIAEQLLTQSLERPEADTAPPLTQQHELIREPTEYAEFFCQRSDALNP